MRLIVTSIDTDDCTYTREIVVPVVYESSEEFLVDFEKALKESVDNDDESFIFANREWDCEIYFRGREFYLPVVETVDEWFSEVEQK
jgi:hypothetical protein